MQSRMVKAFYGKGNPPCGGFPGICLDLNGLQLNYHGGWVKGYRADVAFLPEHKVGYVMLMNAESNMINSTTAEFWKRYLKKADADK